MMNDYYSAVLNRKTKAMKHMRFTTFPPFLVVQLNRYNLSITDLLQNRFEVE